MSILAQDTMVRPDQTGWGTASDGNTWFRLAGNSNIGIQSDQATIKGSNQNNVMALGTGTAGDQEIECNLTVKDGIADLGGLAARINGSGDTFYTVRIGNFGAGTVELARYLSNAQSTLDIESFGWTWGTSYTLKLQTIGSVIKARIWQAGTTEPSSWLLQATDSAIASGRYGVYGNPFSNGAYFDHFVADDTQTGGTGTKLVATRLRQYAQTQKQVTTRLAQYAQAQKRVETRLAQYGVARKTITTRLNQGSFHVAQKTVTTRLNLYAPTRFVTIAASGQDGNTIAQGR